MVLAILRGKYEGDGFFDESTGVLLNQIGNRPGSGKGESPWAAECKVRSVDYRVPGPDTVARAVQAAREGRG
jgi:hypothetical protein